MKADVEQARSFEKHSTPDLIGGETRDTERKSDPDSAPPPIDVARVRRDFPILKRKIHGRDLVYLDNAATTQKPEAVIDALAGFYRESNANVHRGVHTLAEEATSAYEDARRKTARFIGAHDPATIVFTRNTTESINLVAHAWGRMHLRAGDEILLSVTEHHSNLVPWQMLAERTGVRLRFLDIGEDGRLRLDQLDEMLTAKTRLVSIGHISNALGTINPIREIAAAAHAHGALMLVDGAQGVPHGSVDVRELGADFYAFSPHKCCGPLGIGVLWAQRDVLEDMTPFLGGGEMIRDVTLEKATYAGVPTRFEAGTPSVADAVGWSAAIDYLESVGMAAIREHGVRLSEYALEKLGSLPYLELYGPREPEARCSLVSFNDREIHPHDLGTIVDRAGVAIRAGHHCAKPLMRRLGVMATARASFYFYNDRDDVDALVDALVEARKIFGLTET